VHPDIVEGSLDENCTYTLRATKDMILFDFGVNISTLTISDRLLEMLYTLKQVLRHTVKIPTRPTKIQPIPVGGQISFVTFVSV